MNTHTNEHEKGMPHMILMNIVLNCTSLVVDCHGSHHELTHVERAGLCLRADETVNENCCGSPELPLLF